MKCVCRSVLRPLWERQACQTNNLANCCRFFSRFLSFPQFKVVFHRSSLHTAFPSHTSSKSTDDSRTCFFFSLDRGLHFNEAVYGLNSCEASFFSRASSHREGRSSVSPRCASGTAAGGPVMNELLQMDSTKAPWRFSHRSHNTFYPSALFRPFIVIIYRPGKHQHVHTRSTLWGQRLLPALNPIISSFMQ